jgi:LmbE family N-acetylglucosaminyl deacetylase
VKLLIDPHGDDAVLFASFTVMRERPLVLVVFDSFVQPLRGALGCDLMTRRRESLDAMVHLDPPKIEWLGFRDGDPPVVNNLTNALVACIDGIDVNFPALEIWAPAYEEGGHEQHNLVARACDAFEGSCRVHRYLTYTRRHGKSRLEDPDYRYPYRAEVLPRSGEDIARKHRALACFKSQMQLDPRIGCADWFMNDLREYALIDSVERVDDGSEKR